MTDKVHSLVKNGRDIEFKPDFASIDHLLRLRADKYGAKAALVFEPLDDKEVQVISYKQLDEITRTIGSYLVDKYRFKKGDVVALAFENNPVVILINFACWRIGLVTMPLDTTRDTLERKIYKIGLSKAKVLITGAGKEIRSENEDLGNRLKKLEIREIESYKDLVSKKLDLTAVGRGTLRDDCLILFTSGTTADPKGSVLTGESLMANAASIQGWLKFGPEDRWLVVLPLHHINSTTFVNTTFMVGGTVVLVSRYSKSQFWNVLAKHKATGASIVPTIAYDLLSEVKTYEDVKANLKTVSRVQLGSAPVQPNVVEKFMDLYDIPLVQGYGQTETSLRSTGVPMDLSKDQFKKIRGLNSVGTSLEFTYVGVIDDNGNELGENEIGEICVRGPIIMKKYLKNTKATNEAFAHGWFHSGDTGFWRTLYGRQFIFLKGRTKEIIKKGGVLISPLAIENTILDHYKDLEMVYVVGLKDARMGEEIGVVVVASHKAFDKFLDDINSRRVSGLNAFEMPVSAVRVTEEELPKTSTGKIQRINIKKMFNLKLSLSRQRIIKSEFLDFRVLEEGDQMELEAASGIDIDRWPAGLGAGIDQFKQRAKNGIVIAVLDNEGQVLGSTCSIRINDDDLLQAGKANHWTSTWQTISGRGEFTTNNNKGDSLLCLAISVKGQSLKVRDQNLNPHSKEILNDIKLKEYLESDKDSVMRFHMLPKGGYSQGAKIVRVIESGRPEDKDALGFNVLMVYPKVLKKPILSVTATIGVQLIEAVMAYAYKNGISKVYVYSRPSDLSKYFTI